MDHLAAAGRALRRDLRLVLLEPAPGGAAAQADRRPVAEHLSPLLAQPVRALAHTSIVAAAALAAVAVLAPPARASTTKSCGSLTVAGTGTVTASSGGGAACLLAAFRSCTPATYDLSLFGVDTIARTHFAVLRHGNGCTVSVGQSLEVVPQKPRPGGTGRCTAIARRSSDIAATDCRGSGLAATISLTGRRP